MATSIVRMQQRRDSTADWESNDPILLPGEVGYDTTTHQIKIGDGTSTWTELLYANLTLEDISSAVADSITEPGPAKDALTSSIGGTNTKVIYVGNAGDDANSGLDQGRPKKTLAAALTAMGTDTPGLIVCAPEVIDCGPGVSLSGYACGIVGTGYGYHETTSTMKGTVLKATAAQTRPVLDMDGWKSPGSARGRVEFGNFTIEGDNTADATKAHKGLSLGGGTLTGLYMHDITVWKTGGACFDFGGAELCDFERLTAYTPVSAEANDVPYMTGTGPMNCNRFLGLGFRSTSASNDTGVSGALVLTDDGSFAPDSNDWFGTWFEHLHVPNGGCLVSTEANEQLFWGTQFVDCGKETGATGTTHFRFNEPSINDHGGNAVLGRVPGDSGGGANAIDSGCEFNQSNNAANGVKGFQGSNVIFGSGVDRCSAVFFGCEATSTAAAVVDNSGTSTNIVIDHSVGLERRGISQIEHDTTNEGFTVSRSDGGVPGITLRASGGPRWFSDAGTTDIHRSDSFAFQALDATSLGFIDKFAGWRLTGAVDLHSVATTTSAPSAGAGGALPATPAGYATVSIGGVARKIAYY